MDKYLVITCGGCGRQLEWPKYMGSARDGTDPTRVHRICDPNAPSRSVGCPNCGHYTSFSRLTPEQEARGREERDVANSLRGPLARPIGKVPTPISVYSWNDALNRGRGSGDNKATLETIRKIDGAAVIEKSRELVDSALLDSEGFYRPNC
jgi:hypothetical protein